MPKKCSFIILCVLTSIVTICYSQPKPIYLYGTCSDSTVNKVSIVSFSPFWWNNEPPNILTEGIKLHNNTFRLKLSVLHPEKVQMRIKAKSWEIFVSPGDSIHFDILPDEKGHSISFTSGHSVSFTGKNSSNYNYYVQLAEIIRPDVDDPRFDGDIMTYQARLNIWNDKKNQFLRAYINGNQISEEFKWFVSEENDYERCVKLYSPIMQRLVKFNDVPENYFDGVGKLEWNNDRLLEVRRFNVALVIRNIYCYTDNPWANFSSTLDNIKRAFTGKTRQYLISSMIDIYAKEQSFEYYDALLDLINNSGKYLTDSTFIKQVPKSKDTYLLLNKPLPHNVLTTTYLKNFNTNTKISLAKLLDKHSGKSIYIDFWANWCGACRVDISESWQSKAYLKSKDVVIIYISIDKNKDENKWRNASVHDGITEEQYLLQEDLSSPLAKYLTVNFIPRYVLLDRKHLVSDTDAPRLNEGDFSKLKANVSKMQQQIITFK